MGDRLFGQNTMDNHDTHNRETHTQYLSPHKNRLHNTSSLTPRQQLPTSTITLRQVRFSSETIRHSLRKQVLHGLLQGCVR